MALFISHISALQFWRACGRQGVAQPSRERLDRCSVPTRDTLAALPLDAWGISAERLHLLVPAKGMMRQLQGACCHLQASEPPPGSFQRLAPGALVASPELCFVQMAQTLSLPALIALGYELCGQYALVDAPAGASNPSRTFLGHPPLMTRQSLDAYLARAARLHGVRLARRAAPYLMEESGSLRETLTAMMLCLPCRHGGYGLPTPQLNYRIESRNSARGASNSSHFRCDLAWPSARFALEYEGARHHAGIGPANKDSARRAALAREGFTIMTVWAGQLEDARKLDDIARVTAKKIGYRIRTEGANAAMARYRLRKQVLSPAFQEELLGRAPAMREQRRG